MPRPQKDAPAGFEHMMAYLAEHSFRSKLHRWRFNLVDGTTREERLDERIMEFGMINQRFAGRKYRYAFSTVSKPGWFLFEGFVKHALVAGTAETYRLPEGCYASEAPFAPRIGAVAEDDESRRVVVRVTPIRSRAVVTPGREHEARAKRRRTGAASASADL